MIEGLKVIDWLTEGVKVLVPVCRPVLDPCTDIVWPRDEETLVVELAEFCIEKEPSPDFVIDGLVDAESWNEILENPVFVVDELMENDSRGEEDILGSAETVNQAELDLKKLCVLKFVFETLGDPVVWIDTDRKAVRVPWKEDETVCVEFRLCSTNVAVEEDVAVSEFDGDTVFVLVCLFVTDEEEDTDLDFVPRTEGVSDFDIRTVIVIPRVVLVAVIQTDEELDFLTVGDPDWEILIDPELVKLVDSECDPPRVNVIDPDFFGEFVAEFVFVWVDDLELDLLSEDEEEWVRLGKEDQDENAENVNVGVIVGGGFIELLTREVFVGPSVFDGL